jgi:hypothetical protein
LTASDQWSKLAWASMEVAISLGVRIIHPDTPLRSL